MARKRRLSDYDIRQLQADIDYLAQNGYGQIAARLQILLGILTG